MKVPLLYQQQIDKYNHELKRFLQKRNLFGWLRLIAFVATILISYTVFVDYTWFGLIPLAVGMAAFIYLIFTDVDNNEKILNTKTLIQINEEELKILDNHYLHRNDGSEFSPSLHDYANDLDLFGKASLFQWANRCSSEQGKNLFANNLLHPLSIFQSEERQEAIKELGPMMEWRQQLQSYSEQTVITKTGTKKFPKK